MYAKDPLFFWFFFITVKARLHWGLPRLPACYKKTKTRRVCERIDKHTNTRLNKPRWEARSACISRTGGWRQREFCLPTALGAHELHVLPPSTIVTCFQVRGCSRALPRAHTCTKTRAPRACRENLENHSRRPVVHPVLNHSGPKRRGQTRTGKSGW